MGPDRRRVGDGQGAGGRGRRERHQSSSPSDDGAPVVGVLGHELLVGARGDGLAVAQEDDVVGPVEDERARRHDDGRAPGPGLGEPRRDARLGVGVDRARRLDEHECLGVGEQRPGQREALALAAGEGAAALLDLVVEAAGERLEHVVTTRDRQRGEDRRVVVLAPRVELVAQRAGEEAGVGLGHDDPSPQLGERGVGEAGPVDARLGLLGAEPAEPVGQDGGVLGAGGHDDGEAAGLDADAAARLDEARGGRRAGGASSARVDLVGPHPQDPDELACPDVRAGGAVDHLGRRAQRDDEEGRVAVEGDELAGRDLAVDGEARPEPHDDEHEDAGQQHLRRVERRLVAGDPVADGAHGLRLARHTAAGRCAHRRCRAARAARRRCRRPAR